MKKIIDAVDRKKIEAELTEDKFVRNTNNGYRKLYIVTHHDSPNTMLEIGRLREISFRDAGGGTGKEVDIDKYDTAEVPYRQLIVWCPNDKEIIGGYRFIQGNKIPIDKDGNYQTATAKLFDFSEKFKKDYLPYLIELGRSFVQPIYQASFNIRKGLYSLDNLWDGLGSLIVDNPDMKYYFGKITMYPRYNISARDILLFFLHKHFPDKENLISPIDPVTMVTSTDELNNIFNGKNFDENYKILVRNIRRYGESIPPMINAYMSLSPTMKTFGTAINHNFGQVEETGIIITINDIYHLKKERHVSYYKKKK